MPREIEPMVHETRARYRLAVEPLIGSSSVAPVNVEPDSGTVALPVQGQGGLCGVGRLQALRRPEAIGRPAAGHRPSCEAVKHRLDGRDLRTALACEIHGPRDIVVEAPPIPAAIEIAAIVDGLRIKITDLIRIRLIEV